MILDFLVFNVTNLYLATVLIHIFKLNDHKLYFILIIDIIINVLPIVTIFLIIFYLIKNFIFSYIKECFITRYGLIIVFYFIFGIFMYGIYNGVDMVIINYLINNLFINMFMYYIGIKYLTSLI